MLATLHGANDQDALGTSVAWAGDVDADGQVDFISGAPNGFASGGRPGYAKVYSGAGFGQLHTLFGFDDQSRFGQSVAGGFKMSGTVHSDLLVGAPDGGYMQHGEATFFHGGTGKVMNQWVGFGFDGSDFGWSVTNAGLVDYDSQPDFLVGDPTRNPTSSGWATLVKLGQDPTWWGPLHFGWDVEGDLDVNGDGAADVAVSSPLDGEGVVHVYDGETEAELATFRGDALGDGFGYSIAKLGDVDGDGFDELVVGSDAGYARIVSPARQVWLLTVRGSGADEDFGHAVAGCGDLDGDGVPDFGVGAPRAAGPNGEPEAGRVDVFSSAPLFPRYCTAGTSASGCQARLTGAGQASASLPSGFDLVATEVEGDKRAIFFFGANGRQANPWGNGTSYQCVLPPVKRAGVLDKNGTAGVCDGAYTQDLNAHWCPGCPKPQHGFVSGTVVQAQLWYRDPGSTSNQTTSLSNAVEFVIAP